MFVVVFAAVLFFIYLLQIQNGSRGLEGLVWSRGSFSPCWNWGGSPAPRQLGGSGTPNLLDVCVCFIIHQPNANDDSNQLPQSANEA